MIQQLGRRTVSLSRENAMQRLIGQGSRQSQCRHHHPNPFDPKTTKGWKAAVKVGRFVCASMLHSAMKAFHLPYLV